MSVVRPMPDRVAEPLAATGVRRHGLKAYKDGRCRCEVCRAAMRANERRRGQRRRSAKGGDMVRCDVCTGTYQVGQSFANHLRSCQPM